MIYLGTFLIVLSLILPAMSVGAVSIPRCRQGRWHAGIRFEAGEQNSPNAVTKEKAAEIAADFMTTFYHVRVGALETQEFRTTPVSFGWCAFRTRSNALPRDNPDHPHAGGSCPRAVFLIYLGEN